MAVTSGLLFCGMPVVLFGNVLSTLRLFDGPDESPAAVHRYEVLLVVAAVLLVVALVTAARTGVRWVAFTSLTLVPVVLLAAYVFAVPQGRWHDDGGSGPLPANYHPCYSGTDSCAQYGG